MRKEKTGASEFIGFALLAALAVANPAMAQVARNSYPNMAPLAQYLMTDEAAERALALSAVPQSIAREAGVLVLSPKGFETAVKSRNGFVCMVARSWTSAPDADFWNPKVRVPMCFNAAAARSYLPNYIKKTELVLAGKTKAQMSDAILAAIDKGQLPPLESGAMCYMLSKDGYGGDVVPHWPPHLMFYYPQSADADWGANRAGSPVESYTDTKERLTAFVVVVQRWSDGTDGPREPHVHP
jgi:hypothetical protein